MEGMKTYIILTGGNGFYEQEAKSVYALIYDYYKFVIGDSAIFCKMCLNDNIFTIDECINFVNNQTYNYDDNIIKIYELGEQIYGG